VGSDRLSAAAHRILYRISNYPSFSSSLPRNLLPIQPGDVPATCADVDDLMRDAGFRPKTTIEEGISRFVDWYRGYYGV